VLREGMKLKLLKGIVRDTCARVSSVPFISFELTKEELPLHGSWIIDLKKNLAKDEKGRDLTLRFVEQDHAWFLRQIAHANIPPNNIREGRVKD